MQNTKLSIPKALHEFHGEKSTIFDVVATYLAGCIAGVVTYGLMPAGVSTWEQALLLLLALDIGGGVVANFTEGTNRYHKNNPTLRLVFIAPLHLIHPTILAFVFPGQAFAIVGNAALIILCTYGVNYIKTYNLQRTTASLLLLLALAVNIISLSLHAIASFLLALFAIKLILSYAVRWKV